MEKLIEDIQKERTEWVKRMQDFLIKCEKNNPTSDNYTNGFINGVIRGLNLALTIVRNTKEEQK